MTATPGRRATEACPCGFAGDREQACRCTPEQVRRYQLKVSGPLLDRVDLIVSMNRDGARPTGGDPRESSAEVRTRVAKAAARQIQRGGCLNARLAGSGLRDQCRFDGRGEVLLEAASSRFALSARAQDGVRRVARTLADLRGTDSIGTTEVAEAISLRAERVLGAGSTVR